MKSLIIGDLHLSEKTPINRKDDIVDVSLRKLKFILDTAKKEKVDMIIQPGDFTDTPVLSYSYLVKVISLLNSYSIPIITTWGQHDLRHRNKGNTALDLISASCLIYVLSGGSFQTNNFIGVDITGCPFGEDIPTSAVSPLNILVTHRMIIEDKKLWADQENFDVAVSLLKKHPFDLIVSGDNHKSFVCEFKDRILINCGATIRTKIDQAEHRPVCYVLEGNKIKKEIFIPIESGVAVFDFDKVETPDVEEVNEHLEAFISGLPSDKTADLKFNELMTKALKEGKVSQGVKDIINGGMTS